MKYVIIDIPENSIELVQELGIDRIKCFVSDDVHQDIENIPIIPFNRLKEVIEGNIIIFSDSARQKEYDRKIKELGIKDYVYKSKYNKKKEYILFGAGTYGKIAYNQLGAENVYCFLDNHKSGSTFMGKKVISFSALPQSLEKHTIMVCSAEFSDEMEKQLQEAGINNYTFYTERLPQYFLYKTVKKMGYTEILANCKICQKKKIVIYGVNDLIEELICEIAFQNKMNNIIGIVECGKFLKRKSIMGIPCISLEQALQKAECFILNVPRKEDNIREILEQLDCKKEYSIVDLNNIAPFVSAYHHPELSKYKDIHKGKRAFIVGNGPSLRIEDLETLHKHGEICFAANKIYRIYNQTNWRADYLCLTDHDVIDDCGEELDKLKIEGEIFYGDCFHSHYVEENSDRQYIHLTYEEFYPNYPGFSDDITKQVYQGFTVTYDIPLQMAAYMGFKEIYLIGNDCTSVGEVTDKRNHFMPDYYKDGEAEKYKGRRTQTEKILKAFEKAELHSRKHGFRIYNATRGGALEVFERVNFDSLFQKGGNCWHGKLLED